MDDAWRSACGANKGQEVRVRIIGLELGMG